MGGVAEPVVRHYVRRRGVHVDMICVLCVHAGSVAVGDGWCGGGVVTTV